MPWSARPNCHVGVVSLALVVLAAPVTAREPAGKAEIKKAEASLSSLGLRIGNLESTLAIARNTVGGVVAEARFFPTERRLLDADLFFETQNYERAATLYRDLVDDGSFKNKPGYYKALFKLGESLYLLRNFITARRYFRLAATPAAGADYSGSIARLFEIAVRTRDFSDCERFESMVTSGSVGTPDVLYSYGKYLYFRDRPSRAESIFGRVAPGNAYYARARYFLGVLAAKSGRFQSALTLFQAAADQAPATDRDREVQGLALLALSRINFQLGKYMEAVEVIQRVDTTSSAYPQALFDTAWVYLKLDDMDSAAHALDLLMMTGVSGELALKGGALRGRILTRMEDNDAASEAYEEVSNSIGPVAAELERMTTSPSALAAYFDWIIKKDTASFQMDVPVSESTARWLRTHPDLAAMVRMFGDLSHEKEDIRESFETADRLLWTLRSGGELITFPALKEKVLRLKDIEGQFLGGALDAVDVAAGLLVGRLPGDAGIRYEAAVRLRRGLERKFRESPQSYDEYLARERKVSSAYREVDKQLFMVESFLDVERGQVVAIEEWLLDARVRGDEELTPERETRIRASLEEEKRLLTSIHKELNRLKESLEKEALSVESQTVLLQDDILVRRDLLAAVSEEATLLKTLAGSGGEVETAVQTALSLFGRSRKGAEAVSPLLKSVKAIAREGAAEFEKSVVREKRRLEETVAELKKAEFDSRSFARSHGVEVFRAVRDRLKDVLLEADLGLVDMAWQREQKVSEKLRTMGLERAEKVRSLGNMERMLKEAVEAAEAQEKAGKEAEIREPDEGEKQGGETGAE